MIEEFRKVGRWLWEEGLVHAGAGNLSVRQGDSILITRRGAMLFELQDSDLITVGMEPSEADKEASIELPSHRAIYKGSQVQSIVHAHPAYAIALSLNEEKIIPQDAEGRYYLKSIPVVKVREPIGSEELTRFLPPIFSGGYLAAVVRGHGSFVVGRDLTEAFRLTSTLENICKIIVLSKRTAPVQTTRPQSQQRPHHRGPAIPPGIGVMDRERYRKR